MVDSLSSQGHKQELRGENCAYICAWRWPYICPVSFQGLWPSPSLCCRGTERSRSWIPHNQISKSWGGRGSSGVFWIFTLHAVMYTWCVLIEGVKCVCFADAVVCIGREGEGRYCVGEWPRCWSTGHRWEAEEVCVCVYIMTVILHWQYNVNSNL